MRIALISDLHFTAAPDSEQSRRGDIADVLLLRAVFRLNRLIKPDLTVVLGDLLRDGAAPDAPERLATLKGILEKLTSPSIVLPGNHDGAQEQFFRFFPKPAPMVDVRDVRFLPFIDEDAPGYNAVRSAEDIARFAAARDGFSGPIVSLQHVCLHPPDREGGPPYNFLNAAATIAAMRENGVALSISGHHHPGVDVIRDGAVTYINGPSPAFYPFPIAVITLENGTVREERVPLAPPEELHLWDAHVHSQFAYCGENVSFEKVVAFAETLKLDAVGFAEHSGQLYFPREKYWNDWCCEAGMEKALAADNRADAYFAAATPFRSDRAYVALEADCDHRGDLLLRPEDRRRADYLIGAMHAKIGTPEAPADALRERFLFLLERLLSRKIDVLAHPFRVFRRSKLAIPSGLFRKTAELLKAAETAAEINFHTNEPPEEFVRSCLEIGVKLVFSSDTHNLAELGDFALHLDLLRRAGFDGDPRDILWRPPRR